MEVKATLKEAVSKKSNEPYKYLSIMLTDTLEKKVFLEPAEIQLLELKQKDSNPFGIKNNV